MKTRKKEPSRTYVAITIDARASRRLRKAMETVSESASALVMAVDAEPRQNR